MYATLSALHQAKQLSFAEVQTFNLDEYYDIDPEDPQSYRAYMNRHLFDRVDVAECNTHLPTCRKGEDPEVRAAAYEKKIADAGGIDLQILGLGENGHIGFNEPTSSLSSRTRIKTLTKSTLSANARLFSANERQPTLAMTMGIGTILDARRILVLATGHNKAKAVRAAIEGPVSAACPASILQTHRQVTFLLDEKAARKLDLLEYYQWVSAGEELLSCANRGS